MTSLCLEKAWWAALRVAHPDTVLLMVWGVPQGHKMLR